MCSQNHEHLTICLTIFKVFVTKLMITHNETRYMFGKGSCLSNIFSRFPKKETELHFFTAQFFWTHFSKNYHREFYWYLTCMKALIEYYSRNILTRFHNLSWMTFASIHSLFSVNWKFHLIRNKILKADFIYQFRNELGNPNTSRGTPLYHYGRARRNQLTVYKYKQLLRRRNYITQCRVKFTIHRVKSTQNNVFIRN